MQPRARRVRDSNHKPCMDRNRPLSSAGGSSLEKIVTVSRAGAGTLKVLEEEREKGEVCEG